MRSRHCLLSIVLVAFATAAFAQSGLHNGHENTAPPDAQKSFDKLKTLEGSWEGTMTTNPPEPAVEGKLVQVSLRVASRGNVLMHDLRVAGIPDNPLTMLYREGDGLQLTHYCDAGNRPRMNGKASADGKSVEFAFLDLSGSDQHGHMHGARFTFLDENRHSEDWTWMPPTGKPIAVHIELRRAK